MSVKKSIYANHLACYAFACRHIAGKTVLELGSGDGYGAQMMSLFSEHIFGVDFSPLAIHNAGTKRYYCGTNFIRLDLETERLSFPQAQIAVAFEVLEHIDNPEEVLGQLALAGLPLIFSVPHNYPHRLHKRDFLSWDDVERMAMHYYKFDRYELKDAMIDVAPRFEIPDRYIGIGTPRVL